MNNTYFVRVDTFNSNAFEDYLDMYNVNYTLLSNDFEGIRGGSVMYSLQISSIDALALKLSFPIRGCMPFSKPQEPLANSVSRS